MATIAAFSGASLLLKRTSMPKAACSQPSIRLPTHRAWPRWPAGLPRLRVTDWQPVVFHTSFTNQGAWITRVRGFGEYAMLDGIFKPTSGTFTAGTTYPEVFSIPDELAPEQEFYSQVLSGGIVGHISTFATTSRDSCLSAELLPSLLSRAQGPDLNSYVRPGIGGWAGRQPERGRRAG